MPNLKHSKLASGEYSTASPVRQNMKKRLDQNGRTRLARACAAQELESAKKYHTERPEDLNVPDNAGNTPLQIAALEGCAEIVKYLLEAGCDINTRNIDKDTPLIDAVENGHLEVVKLLLDAGVNPRAGNAEGDQPYDLVPSDCENYQEMRRIIREAKSRRAAPRKSEDLTGRDHSTLDVTATSPRDSTPAITTVRRKTVRSEATRNDLLWTSATPENLREFAAKGDLEGVANILNVLQKADPESLIAAAKGGHDEALGILLGMGNPEPDPDPIKHGNHKVGYNTPMLAAIGRGNNKVITLLLDQRGFDPTRADHLGRKYYEISKERKGENWEEEYRLLKAAHDNYTKPSSNKVRKPSTRSPRQSRDKGRDSKGAIGKESASPEPPSRRKSPRPLSGLSRDARIAKERKRRDETDHPKGKPTQPSHRKDSDSRLLDPETARKPRRQSQTSIDGKSHSDNASLNRGEDVVKRRRLIAGRPPADRAARRESLMSSDSHSGLEEHPRSRPDEWKSDVKGKRAASPLKRLRTSVSPEPARSRVRQTQDDPKRRKVQREESDSKMPSTGIAKAEEARPSRRLSHSRPGDSHPLRESRDTSRRISSGNEKGSPAPTHQDQDRNPPAKKERRESDAAAAREVVMHDVNDEEAARKAREVQEAVRARLAAEAERDRQEREAREAEEAKTAAAAETAARLLRERAEEDERKRKEAELRRVRQAEEEQQKRLEQEHHRQLRLRREKEEHERQRIEALPHRLRFAAENIANNDPKARDFETLKFWLPLKCAYHKFIDPKCDAEVADDLWLPNLQVAPLLATNDLQLSQCAYSEESLPYPCFMCLSLEIKVGGLTEWQTQVGKNR
jgi:hypothetical protein